MTRGALLLLCLHLLVGPFVAAGDGECSGDASASDRKKADPLKIAAIFSILASGSLGVSIPLLGRWVPALRPEKDWFFVIKAFAAGVILATGFIHILPDAFGSLTSPCLAPSPWQDFPFAGFGAMVAAIGSLAVDAIATGFLSRRAAAVGDAGTSAEDDVEVHAHGHTHGRVPRGAEAQLIRDRVISQVLELGIVMHSVIIGISLGASESPATIRPLMTSLSFHQLFEGIGLGGCIAQAKLKARSMLKMGLFFVLTTPAGIAFGMAISSAYKESSPTALIVEGVLNSASAGILIYMALVDLLAQDFMNARVQSRPMLQLLSTTALLLVAGLMSLLAKWA
ncbi:zinc transporter 8-like [Zingiber officinale]|uniref:zinc transporter 8-like n=1 Tax=Zingiber officinale TaxID=94328 RepID=UPI001C4C32D9|nr:zinc transporter 8-like [Zingiber officinale]